MSLTFVRNAETVERVFRAFEAEDGEAFWAEFAETAVWRGTGVNAPTTLSRAKMKGVYDAFWGEFNYEIVGDLHFQPGLNPETQLPNGSVNGMFLWEISRVDENGERRAVQLWIYESFDFNDEGQIIFTQVFSDLASAYRNCARTPTTGMIPPNPSNQPEPGNNVVVFVHHLKEGLSAEQLADCRRMDEDTLAVAEWSRQPLHRNRDHLHSRPALWGFRKIDDSHATL